jgi:hypothetical protein
VIHRGDAELPAGKFQSFHQQSLEPVAADTSRDPAAG